MVFDANTVSSVHDPNHPAHRVRQRMKEFNDYYDDYFGPERCKRRESNKEKLATLRSELAQAHGSFDDLDADFAAAEDEILDLEKQLSEAKKNAEDENAKLKKQLRETKKSVEVKQKQLETQKTKDADLLKAAEQESATVRNQLNQAKKAKRSLEDEKARLETQVKDLQAQIKGEKGRANKERDASKKEHQKLQKENQKLQDEKEKLQDEKEKLQDDNKQLQGEIETLRNAKKAEDCKQLQERLKEANKKEEDLTSLLEEAKKKLQEAHEKEQNLERQLKKETGLKEDWELKYSELRTDYYNHRMELQRQQMLAAAPPPTCDPTPFYQYHGNTQPDQMFPAESTHPAQLTYPAPAQLTHPAPAQPTYLAQPFQPAPVPPLGPSQINQNMHQRNRNLSDPYPMANNTRNIVQDTSASRSSGTSQYNNPRPSRQRRDGNSSGPHPKANNTTNTAQDTSQSRNSGIPRENNAGPSRRQNGNSSGPNPKANNTTNIAQDTNGSHSPGISRNNNPGPPSSVLAWANSVNLEYIWFTDPEDSKPYESIRVSRGMQNNVISQVPHLDYVWAASVDNWEALKYMYDQTPGGDKASIIMAKHVDVVVKDKYRLDWRLFEQSVPLEYRERRTA